MLELLAPSEMAAADRAAITAGTSGVTLMERAGVAVARAVARLCDERKPIVVLCGPGNNGGDGFVAARLLTVMGYPVRVLLLDKSARLSGDAAAAAARWRGPVEPATPAGLSGAGLIVDALFGAGLSRPLDGVAAALVQAVNEAGVPVLAVDLPSGIDGATGAVLGAAVRAMETVTFFRRKPGHLLLPGRSHCGRVTVADIGIADAVLQDWRGCLFANEPALWSEHLPRPNETGHKYDRGHAVVLSGGIASTGAARLAARAALRAGAGVVTLASPTDALAVNAIANVAVMVRPVDEPAQLEALLAAPRISAAVLGPGAGHGAALAAMVRAALKAEVAVVLDADALTSFESDPEALFSLSKTRSSPVILTPHDGEFDRLFGKRPEGNDNNKVYNARKAAVRAGAVVVLKGADTVVAHPDGRAAIAANATPWLATAGSGDVLAGIAGGLLAQGMPAFEAACAAVWMHGEAGRAAGPGLIAEDLPEALRPVLGRLFGA